MNQTIKLYATSRNIKPRGVKSEQTKPSVYAMVGIEKAVYMSNKSKTRLNNLLRRVCSFYLEYMAEDSRLKIDTLDDAVDMLKGNCRIRRVVWVRQSFCFIARSMTDASLNEIGSILGHRDHSTIIHSLNTYSDVIDYDKYLQKQHDELLKHLELD